MDVEKEIEADLQEYIKQHPVSDKYLDAFRYGFIVGWCKGSSSEKKFIKQMEAVL
jgi:hypothetical protein